MYHRERRKMRYFVYAILALIHPALTKTIEKNENPITHKPTDDNFENNIIDFDEDYSVKFNKKYGAVPWHSSDGYEKESNRYTIVKDDVNKKDNKTSVSKNETETKTSTEVQETTTITDYSVIPIELISTTENVLISILESTTDPDLSVIPLSSTQKLPTIEINQTVILPTSTETSGNNEEYYMTEDTTTIINENETTTSKREVITEVNDTATEITVTDNNTAKADKLESVTTTPKFENKNATVELNKKILQEVINTNSSKQIETRADTSSEQEDVPVFTELESEEQAEVPEDYYDSKDVVPTTAPRTDAISVIFGLAGSVVESVVESVAERVVPKGIFDLFKRMQKQSEALEAERLRSREENGGLGQFTRGILKTISTGLSKPLSQLMAGVRDIGSLDTDRGFVGNVASGVTSVANVANSVVDSFKDRVQAIYPGTVWCGDGHSATARSSDLGLFFFTDTCCRQHDACKIYIKAGETKYGLTNTGLFTRSHCSCDTKFRECLRRTNSLVSAQIGLTYFNVLGPQCFRKAHPIVRCMRKTRITGQKCEEYEMDYTKPKMWQWFDNETF